MKKQTLIRYKNDINSFPPKKVFKGNIPLNIWNKFNFFLFDPSIGSLSLSSVSFYDQVATHLSTWTAHVASYLFRHGYSTCRSIGLRPLYSTTYVCHMSIIIPKRTEYSDVKHENIHAIPRLNFIHLTLWERRDIPARKICASICEIIMYIICITI